MEYLTKEAYTHLDTVDNIEVWNKEDIKVKHFSNNIYILCIYIGNFK